MGSMGTLGPNVDPNVVTKGMCLLVDDYARQHPDVEKRLEENGWVGQDPTHAIGRKWRALAFQHIITISRSCASPKYVHGSMSS